MASISVLAKECSALFTRWFNSKSLNPGDELAEVENHLFRFNLWAENNAAFSESRDSLDWRLRKTSVPHSVIVDLLKALSKEILSEYGQTIDAFCLITTALGRLTAAPAIDGGVENSPEEILDQLFRFSRAIRRSGVLRRFVKVADYIEKDEMTGENLTALFRENVKSYLETTLRSTNQTLKDRILETICLRQQGFAFLRARWRSNTSNDAKPVSETAHQAPRTSSRVGSAYSVKGSLKERHQPEPDRSKPQTSRGYTAPPSATTLNTNEMSQRDAMPEASDMTIPLADLPPRPKVLPNEQQIKCPYCFIVCTANEFNEFSWSHHIIQDLMPFICVLEECPSPNTMYDSKAAWISHMQKEHTHQGWACMDSTHKKPLYFSDERDFRTHIRKEHGDDFSDNEVDDIVEDCYGDLPGGSKLDSCPFCGKNEVELNPEQNIDEHIARRLISLAQISLSWHLEMLYNVVFEPDPVIDVDQQTSDAVTTGQRGATSQDGDLTSSDIQPGDLSDDILEPPPSPRSDEPNAWSAIEEWVRGRKELPAYDPEKDKVLQSISRNARERDVSDAEMSQSDDESAWEAFESSMCNSKFDKARKFMPEGALRSLVTTDFVLRCLGSVRHNSEDNELVSYILNRARKLFAICVYIGLSRDDLQHAMSLFRDAGFDDQQLPLGRSDSKLSTPGGYPNPIFKSSAAQSVLASLESQKSKWPKVWRPRATRDFFEKQWSFLAPVFSNAETSVDIPALCVLPFIEKQVSMSRGSFAEVYKYKIHPDHIVDALRPGEQYPEYVAIKQFLPRDERDRETLSRQWAHEANALSMMNSLNREHIVHLITAFRLYHYEEEDFYLMLEWADGGNLRDLWKAIPRPERTATLIRATIEQLLGLAEALCACHYGNRDGFNYRHGDLKPENILCFRSGGELGTLKITDWGFAKRHQYDTEERSYNTRVEYGTRRYEAPEIETGLRSSYLGQSKDRRSRLSDIWTMGCVTLEFIIWLVYGLDGLDYFNSSIDGPYAGATPYYEIQESRVATVHRAVLRYMDRLEHEPACVVGRTALGDLLEVVRTGLLVVKLPRHMGSTRIDLDLDPQHDDLPQLPDIRLPSIQITPAEQPQPEFVGPARIRADEFRDRLRMILENDEDESYWSI